MTNYDRFDIKRAKDFALRRFLPYGVYICADGREVLFNRDYQPIYQRIGDVITTCNPSEWVIYVDQRWFYDDLNPPTRNKKTLLKLIRLMKSWEAFGYWMPPRYGDVNKSTQPLTEFYK